MHVAAGDLAVLEPDATTCFLKILLDFILPPPHHSQCCEYLRRDEIEGISFRRSQLTEWKKMRASSESVWHSTVDDLRRVSRLPTNESRWPFLPMGVLLSTEAKGELW